MNPSEILLGRICCLTGQLRWNHYGDIPDALHIGPNMDEMVIDDIVWLTGGHDIQGNEVSSLNEATAKKEILPRIGKVEAFAVSGYFSTRNPDHERRIKQ